MFELFREINYLAVLVAGLASFGFAGLWYSNMLFAKPWMAENGFSEKDLTDPKPAMFKSLISSIVLAFGIAAIFLLARAGGPMSWLDGAYWGFFLAVLIHGVAGLPNYWFENRSMKLFLIHTGNSALGMAIMGAILAAWT